jgi:transglutaminase-like putative cysteine protease
MSGRARVADGALGGVATLATTLPVTTLFAPTAPWFRPSVLLVALVVVTGIGMRVLTTVRPLVVVVQALVLVQGTALVHGQGHLWNGVVPTSETGRALGYLLGDAYTTITSYSVPAPSNRGVVLGISLLVGLTALAVDALAVTWRSPGAAGVPLLAAYLGSATNSGEGLAAWYIVPPALLWLAMVGRQGVRALRTWGMASPRSPSAADPTSGFATAARVAGVFALAAAVLVPGLVPHLPTTFLAEGLGRSENGRGGGSNVRLSSSIDVARDLADRSSDPVLVYRTSGGAPVPLRVDILDTYRRGRWTSGSTFTFVPLDGRLPGTSADPSVQSETERIDVTENRIGIPQVALPENATGSPFPDGTWHVTTQGLAELTDPVEKYTVDYQVLDPAEGDFTTDLGSGASQRDDLLVDPAAEAEVRAILSRITDPGDSPVEVARKIQDYLRGSEFTYSEELADDTAEGLVSEEPVVRFLETKRGYCVQFASAMIMLSRAAGIPARMAVGFLPGTPEGQDRVIRVNDAHAWPELYFPRLGWMRFEPTPGIRSGAVPAYAVQPAEGSGPSSSATPTTSSSANPSTDPRLPRDVDPGTLGSDGTQGASTPAQWLADNLVVIGAVLVVVVLLLLVPGAAWVARRRALARSRDEAERVEAEWESLVMRLGDIGVTADDGATPRQASAQLGRAAYLTRDEDAALGRVVATLEQARYARPGGTVGDVEHDARTVWRAAFSRRRRLDRVRAVLLPEQGLRWWRTTFRRDRGPGPGSAGDDLGR